MEGGKPWILITGGAGYIGSHTVLEFVKAGYPVVIVDNLSTSNCQNYYRIIYELVPRLHFEEVDLRNRKALEKVFQDYPDIDTVIHFAGYKAVGESVQDPLKYYNNNLCSTIVLLEVMLAHNVNNFIFSSSASVYGIPQGLPISETHPLNPQSPYGKTKYFIEEMLPDVAHANPEFRCVILRYFNPVGADPAKILRENPKGTPENLMPYMVRVMRGEFPHLKIFGDDYETSDGTGVRDYIHVTDLALGHLAAMRIFEKDASEKNIYIYNLGTGAGYSVLEMVNIMEQVGKTPIPYKVIERRSGDVPACYACVDKAERELGWKARYSIEKMCEDSL